jgi:hypothetical protein
VATVKGFADACYKGKKDIAKGIICHEDREGEQKREELIASLIRVKLKRL